MQRPAQRVGVFVDVQNMYYSARALFDQRVDFGEILKEAVGERQLVRAIAYVIRAEKEEESKFFDALEERGYELRIKDLLRFYGGNEKGDWDIGISMDVVKMCDKLDAVVLVSGDGDFADLLEYVKSRGCQAEVMAFGSSASSQLREAADAVFDLSQDKKRFLIPQKKSAKKKPQAKRTSHMPKGNRPDPGLPMGLPVYGEADTHPKQQTSEVQKQPVATKPQASANSTNTAEQPVKRTRKRRSSRSKKTTQTASKQAAKKPTTVIDSTAKK